MTKPKKPGAKAAAAGEKEITPYGRTLKAGGEWNPKYPGGVERHKSILEAEGHRVVAKGQKLVVADYETALMAQGLIWDRTYRSSWGCSP